MRLIRIHSETVEREELDRKNFVRSIDDAFSKCTGKNMIIQGFTKEGFPSLYFGRYVGIGQSNEGSCLELEEDNLWYFKKGKLISHFPIEDEVSLISTKDDSSTIARVFGQDGDLIYGDLERINEWDKKFEHNGYTKIFDRKIKSNIIKKVIKDYGFKF
ncbi:hypothetical protein M0R19_06595 [Candidatus Pacearchaeota archaeon]|jgi:uncharacterized protein YneR|nr:hypothetical protein [Candidatus Pacearchaeota archaeon]